MFGEWSRYYEHLDPGQPPENRLILRFREGTQRNEKLSESGPSVYDRLYQVQVSAVGQKQSAPIYTLMKIVDGKEKIEEARAYKQFKPSFDMWRANVEPHQEGTPLEHWPLMTVELVRSFKDANVMTVEMLAQAGDNVANAVRAPFYEWRAKAQSWLKDAREKGGDAKARAENAKLKQEVAELREQVQQLLAIQNGATPGPKGLDKPRRRKNGAPPADLQIPIPDEAAEEFDEDRL